jgi:hypothetical protein
MRIRYWYESLRQRTSLTTAYKLELFFEPDSFTRDVEGSIQYYSNKWIRYEQGRHLPQAALLRKVEQKAPGSTRDLNHPLWTVLNLDNKRVVRGDSFLRQLAPTVQGELYQSDVSGIHGNEVRVPVKQSLLRNLEDRACMDVIACLVWLLRESAERQSNDSVMIGRALHNVLTMMAFDLKQLKIGLPLLRFLIDHILPLGLPQYHRMRMTPDDYVYASAYLNQFVFFTDKNYLKKLSWSSIVKLMQKFLKGKFGFDVLYAMKPYYELDNSSGEIPPEIIKDNERDRRLHEWGWECILSGRQGRAIPADLL